jgi:septation ring formation regulator EzrA
MTDDMTNIVLEHLRQMRGDLSEVKESLRNLTMRFGAVEGHLASLHVSEAAQNSELDRVKQRLDRIERRLELQTP